MSALKKLHLFPLWEQWKRFRTWFKAGKCIEIHRKTYSRGDISVKWFKGRKTCFTVTHWKLSWLFRRTAPWRLHLLTSNVWARPSCQTKTLWNISLRWVKRCPLQRAINSRKHFYFYNQTVARYLCCQDNIKTSKLLLKTSQSSARRFSLAMILS